MAIPFEFLIAHIAVMLFMSILWFYQLKRGEADIVDVGWTIGLAAGEDGRYRDLRNYWGKSARRNFFLFFQAQVLLAVNSNFFWLTLIGPVLMLILILKVSGIPPTEKRALKSRHYDYRDYQSKTRSFVPWFPIDN